MFAPFPSYEGTGNVNERMKRIGVIDRGDIVRRQNRGPKASVYGDNVKRYGLGEHPTKEEKEAIKLEDPTKNSVNTEAGLGGKKFKKGEKPADVSAEKTEEIDKTKSVNEIAGLGGERSGAGEKIEEKSADPEGAIEETEPPQGNAEESGGKEDKPNPENEESGDAPPNGAPPRPDKVLKDFFESLTVAKLKEFETLNELDFGDIRLKAEYIEAAYKSAENNLPNTIMGRTPDINPSDYILYLFEGCGLKIDEKWLPKKN